MSPMRTLLSRMHGKETQFCLRLTKTETLRSLAMTPLNGQHERSCVGEGFAEAVVIIVPPAIFVIYRLRHR